MMLFAQINRILMRPFDHMGTMVTIAFCHTFCRSTACFIHLIEASVAADCARALHLPPSICIGWFALTLLGGNGTLSRIQLFRNMSNNGRFPSEGQSRKKSH
jgi:hypothetical protein